MALSTFRTTARPCKFHLRESDSALDLFAVCGKPQNASPTLKSVTLASANLRNHKNVQIQTTT